MSEKKVIIKYLLIFIYLLFIYSLLNIQIYSKEYFRKLSFRNFIKFEIIPYLRGRIYSSENVLLASNVSDYKIYLKPEFEIKPKIKDIFEKVLKIDFNKKNYYEIKSQIINKILKIEDIERLSKYINELQEIEIKPVYHRYYNEKNILSNVIGYTQFIARLDKNIKQYEFNEVGITGIEKEYDELLIGENGLDCFIVDALGRQHEKTITEWTKKPISGNDIILTIKFDLQKFIHEIFPKDKNGAIIILNPQNGEIYAMSSFPDFDINEFLFNEETKKNILTSTRNILLNRCIQGIYPPGSTIKPFIALKYLENGGDINRVYYCSGSFYYGNKEFKCWKREGHNSLNLINAIINSCNIYFYNLGLFLGYENISEIFERFYLTRITDIDLPYEINSFYYSKNYLEKTNKKITKGEIINMSIGQGSVSITPIKLAIMYSAIANNGFLIKPRILKEIRWKNEQRINKKYNYVKEEIIFNKENIRKIKLALEGVIEYGTGYSAKHKDGNRIVNFKIGGKTGTAQIIGRADKKEEIKPHSWFVCFFPLEQPEYLIVTLVENAGSGSEVAVPLTQKIIEFISKNYMN